VSRVWTLRISATRSVERFKAQPQPSGIDPTLILRVQTTEHVDEAVWRSAGFTVVGAESDRVLLLFSSDIEMSDFRDRIVAYEEGRTTRPNQQQPSYNWLGFVDPASIGPLEKQDRIGRKLREQLDSGGLDSDVPYWLDIELWHLGTLQMCNAKLIELQAFATRCGGEVSDHYIRDGLFMARMRLRGSYLDDLLSISIIATVDLPPRLSYSLAEVLNQNLGDISQIHPPPIDAPHICVIDSGIARGHPLLEDAVGETIAIPYALGDGLDVCGHGTTVAGIALYGDAATYLRPGEIVQEVWIDAARVTNADNAFDDKKLIPTQMREAITYFAGIGCRIFNISLGDERVPYDGGKPSAWADVLDNLAHELDIVIVVSAGNYKHFLQDNATPDDCRTQYPSYLLSPAARIIEPATAANVLTVGAIAREGQPARSQSWPQYVAPIPIAQPDQPSPFTRGGLGVRGAVKPDVVDYGGNFSYDGQSQRLLTKDAGLSIISLNWEYANGALFLFDLGTSFATPRIANLCAKILSNYPTVSANLIRALVAHSAKMPLGVDAMSLSDVEKMRLCGYGRPDANRALFSTDNRVVLITESALEMDGFHIYEVPIPSEFQYTRGERHIAITLAFDPPVRHRRSEYLGCDMIFRLYRGCSLEMVEKATRAFPQGTPRGTKKPSLPDNASCPLEPSPTFRDVGTLQHAVWSFKENRSLDYDEPFYLVVRNVRNWQRETDPAQRYALVVSLEHKSPITMYSRIEQRTRVSQQARIRL